ncbi:MAG: NADPH-dependent F420 reductase [Actinomycetota bacterium]
MDVAIIGGTGAEGLGLALRLGAAGHHVSIGSRDAQRGAASAADARERVRGSARIDGTTNEEAVRGAELVVVTVPFGGQAEIYRGLAPHLRPGQIVLDATSPLATAVGGRAWQVVRPWHGSAAEQAKALLPEGVRIVAGLHTIAADALQHLDRPIESDVLLSGSDAAAKATVGGLIEQIPNLRWVDCGELSSARIAETLTALLISINRAYKVKDSGFRIQGHDTWGTPGG